MKDAGKNVLCILRFGFRKQHSGPLVEDACGIYLPYGLANGVGQDCTHARRRVRISRSH